MGGRRDPDAWAESLVGAQSLGRWRAYRIVKHHREREEAASKRSTFLLKKSCFTLIVVAAASAPLTGSPSDSADVADSRGTPAAFRGALPSVTEEGDEGPEEGESPDDDEVDGPAAGAPGPARPRPRWSEEASAAPNDP